jgi:hypothetical protein
VTKQKLFAMHFCLLRGVGGLKAKGDSKRVFQQVLSRSECILLLASTQLAVFLLAPAPHLCKPGFEFSWLCAGRSAWASSSSSSSSSSSTAGPVSSCERMQSAPTG